MQTDLDVEKLIMDIHNSVIDLERAWDKNPSAVKKEVSILYDASKKIDYTVRKIISGAV